MKKAIDIKGTGRLPNEFVEMFNYANPYEPISPTNKLLIKFLEEYNGHYKSKESEWIIKKN